MHALIRLENVWKVYKLGKIFVTVLKGINLQIRAGRFIAVMGPSGSGKSTLMHILGALDRPTRGKVYFEGNDISKFSDDQLAKLRAKKVGFVFQQFNLIPTLTALENVMLPMLFQGVSKQKRIERAKYLLEQLGLTKRLNHKPTELSGGEQQRVAIARAFVNEPDIILADEPTGNLDSRTGKRIMEFLKSFHKERSKTLVIVTHDPQIAGYAKETITIHDGQLLANHRRAKRFVWSADRRVKLD